LNLHRLVIAAQAREAGFDSGADPAGLGLMRAALLVDS